MPIPWWVVCYINQKGTEGRLSLSECYLAKVEDAPRKITSHRSICKLCFFQRGFCPLGYLKGKELWGGGTNGWRAGSEVDASTLVRLWLASVILCFTREKGEQRNKWMLHCLMLSKSTKWTHVKGGSQENETDTGLWSYSFCQWTAGK